MLRKKTVKPISKGVAKPPVVIQLEALECGAACLTMIMAHYGKWVPLEKVRKDCGVSRDGSKAGNVLKAARKYGLNAQGYRMEIGGVRHECTYPCIIHWDFNHFVVLNGFKGDFAIINDPARGLVKVPMEVFNESFTGIVLTFEPSEDFEPSGHKPSMLRYAVERLNGAKAAMVFTFLTALVTSLLALLTPVFSKIFLDRLLTGRNPNLFLPFMLALILVTAIEIITGIMSAVYSLRVNGKMAAVGSASYMWKVLSLPMDFFSQRMSGDIQSRKETNSTIASTLIDTFAPLLIDAFMMIFYLCIMIKYSLILTFVGVLSIFINLWMSKIIADKRMNITRVSMRDEGKLAAATLSGIEMIETIKASGAENGYFARWSGFLASVNAKRADFSVANNILSIIPQAVSAIADLTIVVIGIYLTIKGQFTLGSVMAFQGFLTAFTNPATTLISAGQTLQEMRNDMEMVEDVLKYESDSVFDESIAEPEEYDKLKGHVELKNVTFGYSALDAPILTDLSIEIKPGQKIALVGPSGCGKSSISKLISGLYQPWSGEILFDGKPIKEINKTIFKSSLQVVDQDIILFEDTVAGNIKMWDESIEDFEMILAARDASIHDTIMQRGGYNKKILEGGRDFSGGQRQRMEIARVLASDPTIIIMDEATSALDAKTEYEVVNAIKERGISCIIVAHRLSTIRDCDEIIVLDKGRIVERGTHEQLYALGGHYTQLVSNE